MQPSEPQSRATLSLLPSARRVPGLCLVRSWTVFECCVVVVSEYSALPSHPIFQQAPCTHFTVGNFQGSDKLPAVLSSTIVKTVTFACAHVRPGGVSICAASTCNRSLALPWLTGWDDHCWSPRREGHRTIRITQCATTKQCVGSDEQGHKHRSHTFPMQTARSWLP